MRAEPVADNMETSGECVMTRERISAYLVWERERGADEAALRRYRRFTDSLYDWLPAGKELGVSSLRAWRESLKEQGYAPVTERNYVKGINRYLGFVGRQDLCFKRGSAKDIAGKRFGRLTALEPTGEKERKDRIWRCRCDCGREVPLPATRLLTGNTLSCGCLRTAQLQEVNRYYDGTSLRMSMEERVHSSSSGTGYTGVTLKGGKYRAYICYKGRNYNLGSYTKLDDAVKARARGKELVRLDAMGLVDFYEELHRDDPQRPNKVHFRQSRLHESVPEEPARNSRAVRSDNSSGCPGVCRNRSKWVARITCNHVTYSLGSYEELEQAIAARRAAEALLRTDPQAFIYVYNKGKMGN